MRRTVRIASITTLLCFGAACNGRTETIIEPPPPPPPALVPLPAAQFVELHDVANAGNGSDLEVTFDAPSPLTGIQSFRLVIIKAAAAAPGWSAVNSAASEAFVNVPPSSGETRRRLTAPFRDMDGDLVVGGQSYRAVVVSMPTDFTTHEATVAPVSAATSLLTGALRITYLWNAGVMLEDDTAKVVIDGLQRRTDAFFIDPPSAQISRLEQGAGRFAGVRLALATHAHEDHVLASSVQGYFAGHPTAWFAGTAAAVASLGAAPRGTAPAPARGTRTNVVINGITVSVLHLTHFQAFGQVFGDVDNYAYLIELGGKKVLHLGDALMTPENLGAFGLAAEDIDIVIIPAWGALISAAARDAVIAAISPEEVVANHLRSAQRDEDEVAVRALYPNVVVLVNPLTSITR